MASCRITTIKYGLKVAVSPNGKWIARFYGDDSSGIQKSKERSVMGIGGGQPLQHLTGQWARQIPE